MKHRKAFAPFVPFRLFRDSNAHRSQLPSKGPRQHGPAQPLQLRHRLGLQALPFRYLSLHNVQVFDDATLSGYSPSRGGRRVSLE
jgi:hypothetical protein